MKDTISDTDFAAYQDKVILLCNQLNELSSGFGNHASKQNFIDVFNGYITAHNNWKVYKITRRARKLNATDKIVLTPEQRLAVDSAIKQMIADDPSLRKQDKFYVELKKDFIKVSIDRYVDTDEDSIIFSVRQDVNGGLHATGKKIGNGAFGTLKIIESLTDGRIVVDKIIKNKKMLQELIDSITPEELEETREILGFSKITIASKASEETEKHHLVVDRIPGEEMYVFLKDHKEIDIDSGFSMAIGACCEILKLHDIGLLHLDIKTQNMMFDPVTKRVTVLDFDFSGKMKDGVYRGAWRGSDDCIAPEIREGRENEYTVNVDLYALGFLIEDIFSKCKLSDDVKHEIDSIIATMNDEDPSKRGTLQECLDKIYKVYRENYESMKSEQVEGKEISSVDISLQYQARKLIEILQLEKGKITTGKEIKKKLHYTILSLQAVAAGNMSSQEMRKFVQNNFSKIDKSQSEIVAAAMTYSTALACVKTGLKNSDKVNCYSPLGVFHSLVKKIRKAAGAQKVKGHKPYIV